MLAPKGRSLGIDQKIALAKELGVHFIRLGETAGTMSSADKASAYQQAGFAVLLNIRNAAIPAAAVKDMEAFKRSVGTIIDTDHPDLIVIENEENNPRFYVGTADEYVAELQAAIDVAHAKGMKVADGGITSIPAAFLTWKHLWDTGDRARADVFAQTAFAYARGTGQRLLPTLPTQAHPDRPVVLGKSLEKTVPMVQALIAAFKTMDLDYVNFHWYESDSRATASLRDIVAYLKEATGKQVISNEFGQLDMASETMTSLLTGMHDLGLPYLVWFSGDDPNGPVPGGGNGPYALQDENGKLRPNGEAFRKVVRSLF